MGPIAYGQWRFTDEDLDAGHRLLETALDAGMNLVDTADVYGFDWGGTGFGQVEEILGRVLASSPGLRDRMVLATKGGIAPPTPVRLVAQVSARGVRSITASAADRRDRPVPDPPARPVHAPGRCGDHAQRAPRRGQDSRGRRV